MLEYIPNTGLIPITYDLIITKASEYRYININRLKRICRIKILLNLSKKLCKLKRCTHKGAFRNELRSLCLCCVHSL